MPKSYLEKKAAIRAYGSRGLGGQEVMAAW